MTTEHIGEKPLAQIIPGLAGFKLKPISAAEGLKGPPKSLMARKSDVPPAALAAVAKFQNFAMNLQDFDRLYSEGKVGSISPESSFGSIARRTGKFAKPAFEPQNELTAVDPVAEPPEEVVIDETVAVTAPIPEPENKAAHHGIAKNIYDGFTPYTQKPPAQGE